MTTPTYAIGSFVRYDLDVKAKVLALASNGNYVIENDERGVFTALGCDLIAWTDAVVAPAINISRFFNIYEGDRVGNLVHDSFNADADATRSRWRRVALAKVTIIRAASGNLLAEININNV